MNENKNLNSETRALALDALRGIAILGMILSSRIPSSLPGWMFHAQNPPPSHSFLNVPGITWVDLVFPFFLFAMGAALPFALNKKLEHNDTRLNIITGIFSRGALLAVFAIIIQHIRPTTISKNPDIYTNLISLGLFLFLFAAYVRLPISVKPVYKYLLKAAGFLGIIIFLAFVTYPDNTGFSLKRSDIIILVLANVSVFGSLIWLFTRNNLLARLSIFGVLLAFRLTAPLDGNWMSYIWNNFQIPWLFKIYYLQYLFIIIPGTIAGDLIYKWLKEKKDTPYQITLNSNKILEYFSLSFLLLLYAGFAVTAFYCRWILLLVITSIILICILYLYFRNSVNDDERFYAKLFRWASYWLMLGLMFESYEGGIQKGKATISFYFTTSALAIFFLISLSLIIHTLNHRKSLNLFILSGQNPMLAYAGGTNMLTPLLNILFIDSFLSNFLVTSWLGALKGLIVTLILSIIVSTFTKKNIFWRS